MKKINVPNISDKERAIAMDRALYMGKLFQAKHFDKIMAAIIEHERDKQKDENAGWELFKEACGEAALTTYERDWLWNYLKNFNSELKEWTVRANPPIGW